MEKKTIGQFIAALRKANGLTQQEVADRLAVSNKAVSRWERDECAPDISVIPALAELLGVTCDELLKGERITNSVQAEKSEPKIGKQVKALINRSVSNFKNMTGISIAISAVGLICMFGISYGFYRPVIGFAVMLLFEAVAVTVAVIAVNKMKANKLDNELFENADKELMDRYDHCLGNDSFMAYFVALAVVMLSLPFVLNLSDHYINSVLSFEYYLYYLGPIAIILVYIYLVAKKSYIARILQKELVEEEIAGEESEVVLEVNRVKRKMNILQIGAVVMAAVLFIVAPFFGTEQPEDPAYIQAGIVGVGVCLLIGNIVCFIIFMLRNTKNRKHLCLSGIRNMLFILPALICTGVHGIGWYSSGGKYTKYDFWDIELFWISVALALVVIIAFRVIEILAKRYKKQRIR